MIRWEDRTWGELIELKYGKGLKDYKEATQGTPVFGTNGQVGYTDAPPLSPIPSIIIGRKGAYREVHYSNKPFYVIDTAYYVVPKEEIDLKWAYYSLKLVDINALDSGSAIPSTRREDVYSIRVKVPPPEIQRKISSILSDIERAIDLNNETNLKLEKLSQTIFKSWFIDFDPVFAKKNVLEAELTKAQAARAAMAFIAGLCSSTEYAENRKEIEKRLEERLASIGKEKAEELEATTSLFPSDFEDSELGTIPSGWNVKTIDEIADVIGGGTPSTTNSEYYCEKGCGIAWLSPKDLSGYNWKYIKNGATDITELGLKKSSARMLPKGSVVISSRAPIGYVAIAEEKLCTNQGFKSLVPKGYVGTDYIYNWAKLNVPAMEAVATGSTFQEISGSNMKNLKLVVPDDKLCKRFEDLIKTNSEYQELLRYETKSLEQLRDSLLPKLISGEINLNNVQIESETR